VNESYAPQTLLTLNFRCRSTIRAARRAAELQRTNRGRLVLFSGASGFAGAYVPYADGGAVNRERVFDRGRPLTQRGEVRTPSWR